MVDEPILVFLHGVGDGDPDNGWRTRLNESLARMGYPDLDAERFIAPKYAHALKGHDDDFTLPPVTVKQPPREAARQNRRAFERRMGAIEFRLGRHERGGGVIGLDTGVRAAVGLPSFIQARNYLTDRHIRAQVLGRSLKQLPDSGRIVIVGHSLGSVIAADLIVRLPPGLEVAGLITIGSPLANPGFDLDKLRELLREPPTILAWWSTSGTSLISWPLIGASPPCSRGWSTSASTRRCWSRGGAHSATSISGRPMSSKRSASGSSDRNRGISPRGARRGDSSGCHRASCAPGAPVRPLTQESDWRAISETDSRAHYAPCRQSPSMRCG